MKRIVMYLLAMTSLPVVVEAVTGTNVVRTFPVSDVRLLAGPFKEAMDRNAAYLLSLDPDRLLHNTRKYCGLEPKGAIYGGWESRGIAGHSLGHYLTALSQHYAATGDKRFRERVDYLVGEMAECQKRYGDGYVGALPPRELEALRDLGKGKVELKGAWVPWYTQHKVLAGLKDAWVLAGSAQAKEVTLKLADWVDNVTAGLTPRQQQDMLRMEFGGMNEVMLELYGLTGDARYLETSRRFYHQEVMDALLAGRDELPGKHANTQIPKIIGEARRYELTGDVNGQKIARFFWDTVVNRHTFALGGNSDYEHFFPAHKAVDHLGPQTAESCNTYNMLKLTEHLFCWEPRAVYADYYERALYNHILASQEPRHGMFTYFVSLKPGHFKTYSDPTNSFWCCVGTGMENHTKYGEAIYFHDGNDLYVNLFIPSTLTWREKGLVVEQQTDYPASGRTEIRILSLPASASFAMKVRHPGWAAGPLRCEVNGRPVESAVGSDGYVSIHRAWSAGDRLAVTIPMALRLESLSGANDRKAFFYGPTLLAGDLGKVSESANYPYADDQRINDHAPTMAVPVLVADDEVSLLKSVQPVAGEPLAFKTGGLGRPADVILRPFNHLYYQYYNVYWTVMTEASWAARKATLDAEEKRTNEENARIVDEVNPGEQQSETDHVLMSERSRTGQFHDRKWRDAEAPGFFEYRMKVLADKPQVLCCTYWGDDRGREFDIVVGGRVIASQKLDRSAGGKFFEVEYPLPPDLIREKSAITIRFQTKSGRVAGGVFGCKVLVGSRANEGK